MRTLVAMLVLWLAFNFSARAQTNSIVWHRAADRVDADVRSLSLSNLLEQITVQTGWQVYVEPGTTHRASTKFKNLPTGDALRRLFGDLNFALVLQTNAGPHLYVFTTRMENATQRVRAPKAMTAKHVPNELLVKLKPGVNPEAFAKMYGAKIIGRMDKLGIYRLEFADAASANAALGELQSSTDVSDVDYNNYFDPPPTAQALASASLPPINLQLNPPGNSGRVIVGLIDTPVQPLDGSLNDFLLKQISVAGDAPASGGDLTHGTAMAETILRAMGIAGQGASSAQILPVDVYGSSATTTSWNVALGIQAAVNGGATVLNLSLGSSGDSSILDLMVQQAVGDGILIFAAAGNQPVSTPTYPAADSGVMAVTATAERADCVLRKLRELCGPGCARDQHCLSGQPALARSRHFGVQCLHDRNCHGNQNRHGQSWMQIENSLKQNFPVP